MPFLDWMSKLRTMTIYQSDGRHFVQRCYLLGEEGSGVIGTGASATKLFPNDPMIEVQHVRWSIDKSTDAITLTDISHHGCYLLPLESHLFLTSSSNTFLIGRTRCKLKLKHKPNPKLKSKGEEADEYSFKCTLEERPNVQTCKQFLLKKGRRYVLGRAATPSSADEDYLIFDYDSTMLPHHCKLHFNETVQAWSVTTLQPLYPLYLRIPKEPTLIAWNQVVKIGLTTCLYFSI